MQQACRQDYGRGPAQSELPSLALKQHSRGVALIKANGGHRQSRVDEFGQWIHVEFRVQISNVKFQISDFKSEISNLRF
jgi:hypothetical protein